MHLAGSNWVCKCRSICSFVKKVLLSFLESFSNSAKSEIQSKLDVISEVNLNIGRYECHIEFEGNQIPFQVCSVMNVDRGL